MSTFTKLIEGKPQPSPLKKSGAEVISYNSETGEAVCKLTGRKKTYKFLNKTGEFLSSGDSVQIWYFTTLDAGFVGLRCGVPKTLNDDKIEELERRIAALEKERS